MPSIAAISFSVSVPPAFLIASTTATRRRHAAGGEEVGRRAAKRFLCSATSQSFILFFGNS